MKDLPFKIESVSSMMFCESGTVTRQHICVVLSGVDSGWGGIGGSTHRPLLILKKKINRTILCCIL